MEIKTLQRQPVNTSVEYSSNANSILQVANASQSLQAKLQNNVQQTTQALEPIITEETKQKALEDVQNGNINSDNVSLVARDVYRRTAEASLVADVEVSSARFGDNVLSEQEKTNRYDTNAMTKSWESFSKGTLSNVKDPLIKNALEQKLALRGQQYVAKVLTLENKQVRELQKENFEAKLKMDMDSLNSAFGVNNEEAVRLQSEVDGTLKQMVESNLLSPNMAQLKRKEINSGAYVSQLQRQLMSAVSSGKAVQFYDTFKKTDHGGILTNDEITKFQYSILTQITTDHKIYETQISKEKEFREQTNRKTTDEMNVKWLDGKLTPLDVDNAFRAHLITDTQYKEYQTKVNDDGAIVDNSKALLSTKTHLLDISKEEIINSPKFTNKTKISLLSEKAEAETKEGNWLSTQDGKESRRRIRESFNIIEGTMMAKMDFENQTMQDYDKMYKKFYSTVQALPIEQRSVKSLEVADNLLLEYNKGKEKIKVQTKQKVEEKKKQDEEKLSKDYNSSVTGKFMNMLQNKWNSTEAKKLSEDFE